MKKFLYLGDGNKEEDGKIKKLFDSSTDIDDTLEDENYALGKGLNFFFSSYLLFKVYEGSKCDTIELSVSARNF